MRLALSALGGQMGGIHMIEVFPDILRPTPCVHQTQIIWDGGIDMIKGGKVSVIYDTLLGILRYVMYYKIYGILVLGV